MKLISLPNVFLNGGRQYAGFGGRGGGGAPGDRSGTVFIEPNVISLAGNGTEVRGRDVVIFGGNNWNLDLRNLNGAAISATGDITLAVGNGGVVDLRGNNSQVLQAGGKVMIAANTISLNPSTSLSNVAGANVQTSSSRILSDVSLIGPGQMMGQPGVTLPINLTVLNGGPLQNTYLFSRSDSANWSLGALPSSVVIGGLNLRDLTLNVTIPLTATSGEVNVITIRATALNDPNLVTVMQVEVGVEAEGKEVYLPIVTKNQSR